MRRYFRPLWSKAAHPNLVCGCLGGLFRRSPQTCHVSICRRSFRPGCCYCLLVTTLRTPGQVNRLMTQRQTLNQQKRVAEGSEVVVQMDQIRNRCCRGTATVWACCACCTSTSAALFGVFLYETPISVSGQDWDPRKFSRPDYVNNLTSSSHVIISRHHLICKRSKLNDKPKN